jgi:hypothetical protein
MEWKQFSKYVQSRVKNHQGVAENLHNACELCMICLFSSKPSQLEAEPSFPRVQSSETCKLFEIQLIQATVGSGTGPVGPGPLSGGVLIWLNLEARARRDSEGKPAASRTAALPACICHKHIYIYTNKKFAIIVACASWQLMDKAFDLWSDSPGIESLLPVHE